MMEALDRLEASVRHTSYYVEDDVATADRSLYVDACDPALQNEVELKQEAAARSSRLGRTIDWRDVAAERRLFAALASTAEHIEKLSQRGVQLGIGTFRFWTALEKGAQTVMGTSFLLDEDMVCIYHRNLFYHDHKTEWYERRAGSVAALEDAADDDAARPNVHGDPEWRLRFGAYCGHCDVVEGDPSSYGTLDAKAKHLTGVLGWDANPVASLTSYIHKMENVKRDAHETLLALQAEVAGKGVG